MSRITPKQYAEALFDVLGEKKISADRAMEHVIALVQKNSDWSKRKSIIEACKDLLRNREGKKLVEISSARSLTDAQRKEIYKVFHRAKNDFEEHTDPELIAGVKIVVDRGEQFDGTLKRKLDELLGV